MCVCVCLRWDTDGNAGDLALQVRKNSSNGLGSTGGCRDDVVEDAATCM
jgi:hypothetical protein